MDKSNSEESCKKKNPGDVTIQPQVGKGLAVGPVWSSKKPCGGTFSPLTRAIGLPSQRSYLSEPWLPYPPEIRHSGVRRGRHRYGRHPRLKLYSGGLLFTDYWALITDHG